MTQVFDGGGKILGFPGKVGKEFEQGISQKNQIGDDGTIFTASFVFQKTGIFFPMVAVFDATPVAADKLKPVFGDIFVDLLTADIVTTTGFFVRTQRDAMAGDFEQGLCVRKVCLCRSDFNKTDFSMFDSTMSLFV